MDLLHCVEQRSLEGIRLGEPARPSGEHRSVDVQQLCCYVTHGKVTYDVFSSDGAVDVLLHSTTHPSELEVEGGKKGRGKGCGHLIP